MTGINICSFFILVIFNITYTKTQLLQAHQLRKDESLKQWLDTANYRDDISEISINPPSIYLQAGKNVLNSLTNDNIWNACNNATFKFLNDLESGQTYAVKVLDSYAKPPAGILDGYVNWLGNFDQCTSQQTIHNGMDSFTGKYCRIRVSVVQNKLLPGLNFSAGICVPQACDANDTRHFVDLGLALLEQYVKNISVGLHDVECADPIAWTASNYIGITFVVLVVCLSVAGTLADALLRLLRSETDRVTVTWVEDTGDNAKLINDDNANTSDAADDAEPEPGELQARNNGCTAAEKMCNFFMCFSWINNGEKLMKASIRDDHLAAVNGIRVLSMSWVILGHTFTFAINSYSNTAMAAKIIKRFSFQAIINGTVSVDSFFFLSGLLVCYLTLKELRKNNGKLNWVMFYIHRYWRLTPAYLFVIVILMTVFPLLLRGPYAMPGGIRDLSADNCHRYWWTNVLYINNFYPGPLGQECMGWGWYLANDTQFYIISPLILYLLFRFELAGLGVIGVLLTLSLGLTGGIAAKNHAQATIFGGLEGAGTQHNDAIDALYVRPYYRIGPYLVGMVTGYALYRYKDSFKPNWMVAIVGWLAAIAVNMSVLYGLYHYYHTLTAMPNSLSAFYIAVNRIAWSLGLAWMTFACITGYGGPINTFLSHGVWAPLGRLTYCAYLIHPIVMYVVYMNLRVPIYYSEAVVIYYYIGHLVLAYAIALVISLLIESPFMALEKIIFK